jgi:hypothetical protein
LEAKFLASQVSAWYFFSEFQSAGTIFYHITKETWHNIS